MLITVFCLETEPIGSSKPKLSTLSDITRFQKKLSEGLALTCPAQGSPVPAFRLVRVRKIIIYCNLTQNLLGLQNQSFLQCPTLLDLSRRDLVLPWHWYVLPKGSPFQLSGTSTCFAYTSLVWNYFRACWVIKAKVFLHPEVFNFSKRSVTRTGTYMSCSRVPCSSIQVFLMADVLYFNLLIWQNLLDHPSQSSLLSQNLSGFLRKSLELPLVWLVQRKGTPSQHLGNTNTKKTFQNRSVSSSRACGFVQTKVLNIVGHLFIQSSCW